MMIDAEMTVVDGTCREGAAAAAAGSSATGRMGEVVLSRTAFTLMQRYLATINDDPTNPRFRRIRLGNTQFKMIWREGAVKELLWAAGWRDDVEEGYLILPATVSSAMMSELMSRAPVTAAAGLASPRPSGRGSATTPLGSEARKRKHVGEAVPSAVPGGSARALPNENPTPKFPTRLELPALWRSLKRCKVLPFYSDKDGTRFREFSNFCRHQPFDFTIPAAVWREGYPRRVSVAFAEKSIMACKAMLFDDAEMFGEIVKGTTPASVKRLGRGVRRFDDAVWQTHIMVIAEAAVTQKFQRVPGLADVLLGTGGRLIAEAAPGDRAWGIGLAKSNPLCDDPTRWRGTNVLGWALMRARGSCGGVGVPCPQ